MLMRIAKPVALKKEDTVDTQLMDPALLNELPSMSTETLLLQTAEEVNESIVHPPFELDENTMRSLQQFIDSHGFQSPPNQVLCDSSSSDLSSLPLSQKQSLKTPRSLRIKH